MTSPGCADRPEGAAAATAGRLAVNARRVEGANAMPAPTWRWLRANETTIEMPELACASTPARLSRQGAENAEPGAFERALEAAEGRFVHLRRESAPGDASARQRAQACEGGSLDVPALSSYQQKAVSLEENYTPALAFDTGMGFEASQLLREAAPKISSLRVPAGAKASATLRVVGREGEFCVGAADIVVEDGAELTVLIALDGVAVSEERPFADGEGGVFASGEESSSASEEGASAAASDTPPTPSSLALLSKDLRGAIGASLRLLAGARSSVEITCVQTADDAFLTLDDTGLFLEEGAQVSARHVVLGAGAAYTGFACELAGDGAELDVETSYLGLRAQERDFNYRVVHRGRETRSSLAANGVLAGASKTALRGSIDLAHGCKGASGSESETVLLLGEDMVNKTVPVILCDDDDVAGDHGATIGHVRPDQLFYLESRGLSAEAAEGLFVRAKVEDAALSAPDAELRRSVVRIGEALFAGFEEDMGGEVA